MNTRSLTQTKPTSSFTPVSSRLLQRKCACGGSAGLTGKCSECESKRLTLQRRATSQSEPDEVPPIVHEVLQEAGKPLDKETRTFMESRFGHDFSQVRVHTDSKAAESARAVNAVAYTVGQNIAFGNNSYAPHSREGQKLIAHELAHTIQQSKVLKSSAIRLENPHHVAEQEAETASQAITQGLSFTVKSTNSKQISRQSINDDISEEQTSRRNPTGVLPYREAMKATEQFLYKEYIRNCSGISVLERLDRQEISLVERIQGLEKRIRAIPRLFASKQAIEQDKENPIPLRERLADFQETQVEGDFPKFPSGYDLSSEENELAIANCELSRANWELIVANRTGRLPGSLLRNR